MAGGTCLCLVAMTVGDAIVPLVMPFVQTSILENDNDWRACEASIYALGLILEDPTIEKLSPWLSILLDNLVDVMFTSNSHVIDRTAWTLSHVFELHSPVAGHSVITQENLPRVIVALLDDLSDSSHIAEKKLGGVEKTNSVILKTAN
ncbi:hypothetical protein POM88_051767 [Heracleum sosnowskyi]|uniref:Uncharacterized protein n=1 Tax=Heracleum sosnowskyi TaxID=360622 RepID=A0AAD8H2V5_9APIA|nr:hypothetical protein POM88_051767 [Heracleum sosnowskyi]